MKLLVLVTLLVGLVVAVSEVNSEAAAARLKVRRPVSYKGTNGRTGVRAPSGAPAGYMSTTGIPTENLSKTSLKKLPINLVVQDSSDAPLKPFENRAIVSRHELKQRLKEVEARQVTVQDFYECRQSRPAPSSSDCNELVTQVYAAEQALSISPNACLLFQLGTCWGFFCSLCEQLSTTTDFVGDQLDTANTLCVSQGQIGTVVGEDAPQWEAGFIYRGGSLPSYDVC